MKSPYFIFLQSGARVNAGVQRQRGRTTLALAALAPLALAGCGDPGKPQGQSSVRANERAGAADPLHSGTPVPTPSAARENFTLDCTNPVRLGETVAAVRGQFGKDARVETMTGAEGIEYQAVVLWSDDPTRRLELPFDAELREPTVSAIDIGSAKSRWRVRGLAMNDPLARVAAANGKPFTLSGFDWDYGGYVTDWQGGKMMTVAHCGVRLGFRPGENAAEDYAAGDGSFVSGDPKVAKARAVVDSLGLVRGE